MGQETYRVAEFAKLTGVTVRTLQHYDRIGLLKPSALTEGGHRIYSRDDLYPMQQIVTLKWMGFSLKQIVDLLQVYDMRESLVVQKRAIDEQIKRLQQASEAIDCVLSEQATLDAETAVTIMQGVMMPSSQWMAQYYSQSARAGLHTRWLNLTEADLQKTQQAWLDLYTAFDAVRGQPLDSKAVQALAARMHDLLVGFTGGDAETEAGLQQLYADNPHFGLPNDVDVELQAMMQQAYQLYRKRNST